MAIIVSCGGCGRTFRARDSRRGRSVSCPGCAAALTVDGPRVPDYDVFISHSSQDKVVADAVVATLEGKGMRCWVAPRDIPPGATWSSAIVEAIGDSRVMVLLFSSRSNTSQQVLREVERAVAKGLPILPVRIEDASLSHDMEYFISASHWLDATVGPMEEHLQALARRVRTLTIDAAPTGAAGAPTPAAPAAHEATPAAPAVPARAGQTQPQPAAAENASGGRARAAGALPHGGRRVALVVALAMVGLLAIGGLWFALKRRADARLTDNGRPAGSAMPPATAPATRPEAAHAAALLQHAALIFSFDSDTVDVGPRGRTRIRDVSGHLNHGIGERFTFVPGKVGDALRLNGDGHIIVRYSDSLRFERALTAAVWLWTTDNDSAIAGQFPEGGGPGNWVFACNMSQLAFGRASNWPLSRKIDDGRWHLVAGVFDGANRRITHYVDGQNVATFADASRLRTELRPIFIGCNQDLHWTYGGLLDELMLFDTALSQEDMAFLYELGRNGRGLATVAAPATAPPR
jgi:TIR domain/Concanavalin A-like lectin/glucanases superfamily